MPYVKPGPTVGAQKLYAVADSGYPLSSCDNADLHTVSSSTERLRWVMDRAPSSSPYLAG